MQPIEGHGKVYPTGSTLKVDKKTIGVEFKPIFVEGWLKTHKNPTKRQVLVSKDGDFKMEMRLPSTLVVKCKI